MTMLCSTLVFASEDAAAVNSAKFGMWTVLPPLVSIVLAFLTKNVVVSLFIGTITGCIMLQLNGFNIIRNLFKKEFFLYDYMSDVEIKHVHELQNLYFAVTKQELTYDSN